MKTGTTVTYFDTSFLLSILCRQSRSESVQQIWSESEYRLSSRLLAIESNVAIRRSFKQTGQSNPQYLESQLSALQLFVDRIHMKHIDETIESIIFHEPVLAECRSLDAIHLATAVFFQKYTSRPLLIATLDTRMRETAMKLGFKVTAAK